MDCSQAITIIHWDTCLECVPVRCLPESTPTDMKEGFMHQLALQHLSNRDREGSCCQQRNSSMEELAMAKWLASTMYYQHPAVHPLPPSLLTTQSNTSDSRSGAASPTEKPGNTPRDLSSFLHGSHSIHNRVRRPAAGCMGGLGTSMPLDNKHGKPAIATVSLLLDQRRHDWQEAFRSMFHSWKSKLKDLENYCADGKLDGSSSSGATYMPSAKCEPPTQDELSRCSFYSILSHQVILFRGGYAEGGHERTEEGAEHCIVPMIVFSSTTPHLRSKLKSMGVDL